MDVNKILMIATEAGRIILENGGETYRVEETILRICSAFNIKNAESFVTATGIMVSVTDAFGQSVSTVRRIKSRSVNLEKIALVNDLSRSIKVNGLTCDEVKEVLEKIEGSKRYNDNQTIFFSALAAAFFTLIFGGNFKDFCISFIIGGAIKYMCIIFSKFRINDFFTNIFGGALSALVALISVKFGLASSYDNIIIGSIMLLVPGLAITNAIRDTIAGDLVAALSRALEAFLIAVAIATGSGTILALWFKYIGGF